MQDGPVARYRAALDRGDLAAARAELTDDLQFRGPFDEFATADDYAKAIERLWRVVESVEVRHTSSAGDEVVVLYDMATRTPAGTQLICEWYGVRDDKIAWIRAIFDSAPFAFLRAGGDA
jgi:SnoaL-like domain